MVKDYLLGGIVGALILGAITLLGTLFAGKEAMGLGDVKLIGSVGLFFGVNSVLEIALLAFLLGAIFSIFIIGVRLIRKKQDEYMPFGPFLALSSLACIFLPPGIIIETFLAFCQMLSYKLL